MSRPGSEVARVGLLQCGPLPLAERHGDYPERYQSLLGPHGVELVVHDATAGSVPPSVADADGWLVSGSTWSAYEDLPWIDALAAFLRAVVAAERPLVAVCFGHQLLARALGGRVERAPVGWGVGAHRYDLTATEPWMSPPPPEPSLHLIASHQDQVVAVPDGARVWARSDHCEIAGFSIGTRAVTIQPHPEFGPELSRELIERRRDAIGGPVADAALAGLGAPLDDRLVGAWLANVLRADA